MAKFIDSAPANPGILAVVAIGSAVRPNVHSADLDVIVICTVPLILDDRPPLEIDLRTFLSTEIDRQIESGHDLPGWAIRFGKALFQRDHYWDECTASWRHRLPLPSSALARERAAGAERRLIKMLESGDEDAAHDQVISYLTHLARAELIDRGVYPASRPELAGQLIGIGSYRLAEWIERFSGNGVTGSAQIDQLLKLSA
jgi:hypothetical protein